VIAPPGAAHQRVQSCLKLGQGKGFGQEVVRARIERTNTLVNRVARRKNQRGQTLVPRPQPLQDDITAEVRQAQIENGSVVVLGGQPPIGKLAVVHPFHLNSHLGQRLGQPCAKGVLIFGKQDSHREKRGC